MDALAQYLSSTKSTTFSDHLVALYRVLFFQHIKLSVAPTGALIGPKFGSREFLIWDYILTQLRWHLAIGPFSPSNPAIAFRI